MRNLLCQRRTWIFLSSLLLFLFVLHPLLLPLASWHLTREDEPVDGAKDLLFLRSARSSQEAFDFASEFAKRDGSHRILVIRDFVRRAEAIGAEAPFLETTIEMLEEEGVPRDQIEVIGDGVVMTTTEKLRFVSEWLQSQPEQIDLLLATETFGSGFVKFAANEAMTQRTLSQIHVIGFDRGGVNSQNWWKSPLGLKDFFRTNLRLIHLLLIGENRPNIDWDPDEYEKSLLVLRNQDD